MRLSTISRLSALALAIVLLASCGVASPPLAPGSITPTSVATGIRHLSFDTDVVNDPHVSNYLFVKGVHTQYLFPDAETFRTAQTVIIEAYDHIFVFPLSVVKMRRLSSLTLIPTHSLQAFIRPLNRLDAETQIIGAAGTPAPSPQCPDCIEYIDARMYDKNGKYLGIIDLSKVMRATPPTSSSHRRTPQWNGWPGICGNPASVWYYDTYCIDDYYFGYESYIEIIWNINLFRSPGVVSYTWSKSTLESDMIWNWSGFNYAGSYVTYNYYIDITANFDSRVINLPASAYNHNIEMITTNTHTYISQSDVVVDGIQTSPNGTKTTITEGSRTARIATPI